ncbi:MAG: hypothetical protein HLX45_09875, partial [Bacillus sp. (in: Bacteria)]|nr:hypothetical protein [Bacillus sp. (in: firmicutes)]
MTSHTVCIATDRTPALRCASTRLYGPLLIVRYPRFPTPTTLLTTHHNTHNHPLNLHPPPHTLSPTTATPHLTTLSTHPP